MNKTSPRTESLWRTVTNRAMLTRKSRGSECLGRPSRHCNSLRESVLNPEEIPLTSLKTTSDDTDQDDSPYRRPLFDTNEKRRGDTNRLSKWYALSVHLQRRFLTFSPATLVVEVEQSVYMHASMCPDSKFLSKSSLTWTFGLLVHLDLVQVRFLGRGHGQCFGSHDEELSF